MAKHTKYIIYTDGSCLYSDHRRPGAWGYCILLKGQPVSIKTGCEINTTNNRMEMKAVLNSFKRVSHVLGNDTSLMQESSIRVYSDSQYVVNGYMKWYDNWIANKKDDIKNPDLWMEMKEIGSKFHKVELKWVRGHSGNKWNEFIDDRCTKRVYKDKDSDYALVDIKKA